jgi:hypothetical protein
LEPQETVLVGRQYAASGPPSAGRQHVFDLRSQGLPQLSTTYAPDELAPLDPEDDPDDVPEDVPDELDELDEPLELGPDELPLEPPVELSPKPPLELLPQARSASDPKAPTTASEMGQGRVE